MFHAGDGNLHPLVCYDGSVEGEPERAEELAGLIVKACVDEGGSITGEHGVGVDKKRYMPSMFGEDDLATFQRLRCAFDPDGLANPGKVMPTPRLCGEVPGPVSQAPARGGRDRGADVSGVQLRSRVPASSEAAAAAALLGRRVRFAGGAARSSTGAARRARRRRDLDRWSSTGSVEHNVGDLTAVLDAGRHAGRRAGALRRPRADAGARPPLGRRAATIGGIVATADSGPLRHRYGSARDLVVGMTVALSDGTVAKSGGKVIKNVAGYDLAKLFAGRLRHARRDPAGGGAPAPAGPGHR